MFIINKCFWDIVENFLDYLKIMWYKFELIENVKLFKIYA